MPRKKLTQIVVDAAKAVNGTRTEYFDSLLPGFALRVSPGGNKSWVVMVRVNGKQRRVTIDTIDRMPKVEEARERARQIMADAVAGIDPVEKAKEAARAAAPERNTVATVAEAFIAHMAETPKKNRRPRSPAYITATRRNLENHVLPEWGKRAIATLTYSDLRKLLAGIKIKLGADGKARKGGGIAANRTLAAIQGLFNYALREGMIDRSPAELAERAAAEEERDRVLTDAEIIAIWNAAGTLGFPFGPFFRVALLTGQRRDEVARMRWEDLALESRIEERDDIDADGKLVKVKVELGFCWTMPAAATKARRAHVVPLSPAVVEILSRLPRIAVTENDQTKPSPWVFTTTGPAPISGFSKAKVEIETEIAKQRDGMPLDRWTIHDLRRTFATKLAENVSEFVIARVLNHARAGVTGRHYNHYDYMADKRRALNLWAHRVNNLVNPPPSNVVSLVEAVAVESMSA